MLTGTPFDFVNVIEDVRIEKYIQAKFPGLKRDFSKGYTELNDKDFFQIADQDVNKMSLIDRLNLHFKLGYRAVVEFAADEKQWVTAIDECDTFQKVCLVAKMLSDWLDQKAEDEQEDTGRTSSLTVLVTKKVSPKSNRLKSLKVITTSKTSAPKVARVKKKKKKKRTKKEESCW